MQSKMLFHVDGIRCHSCVQKIEKALLGFNNIESAQVRMDNSLLEVLYKGAPQPQLIQDQLLKLGFSTKLINKKADAHLAQKIQNRKFLNKIAVAGFSAGNIMLFTVSIYAGADKLYLKYFSLISAILFLPVLLYSATDFYKNAFASIKNKYLSIDLPISIALIGGFIFSLVNLYLKKYELLYFDSTASFIFLILTVRYFLNKLQQHLFTTQDSFYLDESKEYLVGDIFKKIADIKKDDIFLVNRNELVPVDCVLLDKYVEMNTSLLTGESYPKLYQQNMVIPSGSLNISSVSKVKSLKSYDHSYLNQLLEKIENVKKEKGHTVQLADKASHYLVLTIFSIAIGYFLKSLTGDPVEGFQRSLALIIVACPCALALGTPLAYALGIQKAKKLGILIKNQNVFDNILNVKNLFFDKTGTLTNGRISIINTRPQVIDVNTIQLILNLEKISHHPIAYALRDKWGKEFENLELKDHIEQAGVGISASYNGDMYQIKRSETGDPDDYLKAEFLKNNLLICVINFEDKMRSGLSYTVSNLKSKFNNISLISGDNSSLVKIAGEICGIEQNNIHSNLNPTEKFELVKKSSPAMMVGDGINDALSLKEALVGIAVHGAVAESLESCDVYLMKNDLNLIIRLIALAETVRKTILSNIKLSFMYNFIAGFLALSGFINPLVAAVLMPVSSLAIILNTYWRSK